MKRPFKDYCRAVRMDGAANWLLNAGAEDFLICGDETALIVLAEFKDDAAREAFGTAMEGVRSCRPLDAFACGRYCPILIDGRALSELEVERFGIERIVLGSPVPGRALAEPDLTERLLTFRPPPVGKPDAVQAVVGFPSGTRVVVGVIDDGIAIAHERFCEDATQTRVYAHWSMEDFPGTELLKSEIDALLRASSRDGFVDEEHVYRASGIVNYRRGGPKTVERRIAHGAHVCDLAAGRDWDAGGRPRPIIAVSLPADVLADTSGRFLDAHLAMAVGYILDRAERLAEGEPVGVVIVASIGTIAGPHDGSSLIERLMDEAVTRKGKLGPVRIVLPAGNAHMSRCYAELPLGEPSDAADGSGIPGRPAGQNDTTLDWVLLPDDRTMSSMQIWLPEGEHVDPGVRIRLTAPGGAAVEAREGDARPAHLAIGGTEVAMVQWRKDAANGRGVFEIWTLPTARDEPSRLPVAPAGRWRLAVVAGRKAGGTAQAWIQRDDSLYGYPLRGRQSYFDHPAFEPFGPDGAPLVDDRGEPAGPIKRRNLLNALASGSHVLVAGGYVRSTAEPARYSAGAKAGEGDLSKPDMLLPSERSPAARGLLAAGARSGARVALGGTSVAAPLLARFVADRIERGEATDRVAIAAEFGEEGALLQPSDHLGAAGRSGLGLLRVRLREDRLDAPRDRFDRPWPAS